jgi:hypothetical protein
MNVSDYGYSRAYGYISNNSERLRAVGDAAVATVSGLASGVADTFSDLTVGTIGGDFPQAVGARERTSQRLSRMGEHYQNLFAALGTSSAIGQGFIPATRDNVRTMNTLSEEALHFRRGFNALATARDTDDVYASWRIGLSGAGDIFGGATELASVVAPGYLAARMNVANTSGRQIQDVRRISAAEANSFTPKSEIWAPPFPEWPGVRTFTTADELPFVRVHVDPAKPQGGFLVRESEIAHLNGDAEAIRAYLALDRTPAYISDVFVPSGTRMQVGVIGPQPNFGVYTNSGFQYQLLDQIPGSSFRNTRPLR